MAKGFGEPISAAYARYEQIQQTKIFEYNYECVLMLQNVFSEVHSNW